MIILLSVWSIASSRTENYYSSSFQQVTTTSDQWLSSVLDRIANYSALDTVNIFINSNIGDQHLNNTKEVKCNLLIECTYKNTYNQLIKTKIIAKDSIFYANNRKDDCVIAIKGTKTSPISLSLINLEFAVENQETDTLYYIKTYYANKMNIEGVKMTLDKGSMTNIDLRRCSNVTIKNCEFVNYNQSRVGGILWMRGEMENIDIRDNIFRKHGNDEAIAIWGHNLIDYVDNDKGDLIIKKNISIRNNSFYYSPPEHQQDSLYSIDRYIYVYEQDTTPQIRYVYENIDISENTFYLDYISLYTLSVQFDRPTSVDNFKMTDNVFHHSGYEALATQINDFGVSSADVNNIEIQIERNTFYSNTYVYKGNNKNEKNPPTGHSCLAVGGATVNFSNNIIRGTQSINGSNSGLGMKLFYVHKSKANIDINDNVCTGINYIGTIDDSTTAIDDVTLNIKDNYIKGGKTIVYCNNVSSLSSTVLGNYIDTCDANLLFQNYGLKGTLVCRGNTFILDNAASPFYGKVYSTYINGSDPHFFDIAIVTGNVLKNIVGNIAEKIVNYGLKEEFDNVSK